MTDVIRVFLEDLPVRLAAIRDAVTSRDADGLRAAAHALKGAAANLSAGGLFEAASVLERLGAESRLDAAEAAWRPLSVEASQRHRRVAPPLPVSEGALLVRILIADDGLHQRHPERRSTPGAGQELADRAGKLLVSTQVEPEDDRIEVNCGRCGRKILVLVEEVRDLRIIECSECTKREAGSGLRRPLPFIRPAG